MGKLRADSWFGARPARDASKDAAAARIGVLAFEVAALFSKASALWHSLHDQQLAWLRDEALRLAGVRRLVSDDDDFLLRLALSEITDALASLSRAAARLGTRCADPALQRFEHVFAGLIHDGADPHGWEYPARKMDRKVKKMEKLAAATAHLRQELDVLAELEQGLRRVHGGAGLLAEAKHRVHWQRHEVKCLREASLWGRSYDYAVDLLARSLFTIVGRIRLVFGLHRKDDTAATAADSRVGSYLPRSRSVVGSGHNSSHPPHIFHSGPLTKSITRSRPVAVTGRAVPPPSPGKRFSTKTMWPVSGPFKGCMVSGYDSPVLQSCKAVDSDSRIHNQTKDVAHVRVNIGNANLFLSTFGLKHRLMDAHPSTLGSAGLALHYANVIIVIERFAASPHLIGPDARDDLYGMLTTSIRAALRTRLKSYAKNLNSSVYDPVLATEWNEALKGILEWLAPLAHNMIRWQSERNFEQQHLASSTNILLLQTLYFANRSKTEAAITELLVGLNYLWRYARELNAKAILECLSERSLDDYLKSKD